MELCYFGKNKEHRSVKVVIFKMKLEEQRRGVMAQY